MRVWRGFLKNKSWHAWKTVNKEPKQVNVGMVPMFSINQGAINGWIKSMEFCGIGSPPFAGLTRNFGLRKAFEILFNADTRHSYDQRQVIRSVQIWIEAENSYSREWTQMILHVFSFPETNIAPETLGLEDEFPFGKASCQVLCSFWAVHI